MCVCTPTKRTMFCGAPGCVAPPGSSYRVPVDDHMRELSNRIGESVGRALPPGWGFGLFIFTYGENGTMLWLSSANRDDMVKALQEWMRTEGS